jgi:hypothetical protein
LAFWDRVDRWFGLSEDVTPNDNGPGTFNGGDPNGVELEGEETYSRSLAFPRPSGWDGWPSGWATPNWTMSSGLGGGFQALVDTAWACIDLNASILSSLPVYRLKNGKVASAPSWMTNPDPSIYSSWQEFAKQFFWDYQMGEVFVLPMSTGPDGLPANFRVVPPWLVNVDLVDGSREYMLGSTDVTSDILHVVISRRRSICVVMARWRLLGRV